MINLQNIFIYVVLIIIIIVLIFLKNEITHEIEKSKDELLKNISNIYYKSDKEFYINLFVGNLETETENKNFVRYLDSKNILTINKEGIIDSLTINFRVDKNSSNFLARKDYMFLLSIGNGKTPETSSNILSSDRWNSNMYVAENETDLKTFHFSRDNEFPSNIYLKPGYTFSITSSDGSSFLLHDVSIGIKYNYMPVSYW
jgi:hypothetical protein